MQFYTVAKEASAQFERQRSRFIGTVSRVTSEKEALAFNDSAPDGSELYKSCTIPDIKALEFQDIKNEAIITLELSRNFDGRIFHIRSGQGGEEDYQSTCVMPLLPVSLEGSKTWKLAFSLKISS